MIDFGDAFLGEGVTTECTSHIIVTCRSAFGVHFAAALEGLIWSRFATGVADNLQFSRNRKQRLQHNTEGTLKMGLKVKLKMAMGLVAYYVAFYGQCRTVQYCTGSITSFKKRRSLYSAKDVTSQWQPGNQWPTIDMRCCCP